MTGITATTKLTNTTPEHAFDTFTTSISKWWPHTYTWSQHLCQHVGLDARINGHLYELGPHDFRVDWGTVIQCDRPGTLVFLWQISYTRTPVPDPAQASTVTVTFSRDDEADSSAVVVKVVHDGWEKHGADGEKYKQQMVEYACWPHLLECYTKYASTASK